VIPIADDAAGVLQRPVELIRMLTGGTHAETALVATDAGRIVVRRFPPGDDAVTREVRALATIRPLGSWVPRLVAYRDDPDSPLIATTVVPGAAPDPGLAVEVMALEMARALAEIHTLDGAGLPAVPRPPRPGDSVLARLAVAEWPSLDVSDPVLVHRDFWVGNALWQGESLSGVIDWPGASQGPRGVDVAWCRQDLVLLGSQGAADDFLHAYEAASGVSIPDIRAWDVQAGAHAERVVETWAPNYAGIGRPDITEAVLRRRLDAWNATLV
jgi:aminoglycoside phosphotransferase (APT) family kinase protein